MLLGWRGQEVKARAISNIVGTIDEAYDYKTDAVTAANR